MQLDSASAMYIAQNWGRRTYDNSWVVSIARYDDTMMRAQDRLIRSRSAIVRANAGRILRFSSGYRYARFLLAAPISVIESLCAHPSIGGNNG